MEVLTTRLPDVALFAEAPLKYLVFDEAHTYAGATGAEVACLIRRLRALAGKTADEIICIGTSATLSDPAKQDQDNDETARRFASRFFGVDADQGRRSSASPTSAGSGPGSGTGPSPRTATAWPGWPGCWRPITEPVDLATIKAVVEELTGQIFEPGDDWRESLFDHLVTNEYVYQATQILKHAEAARGGRLADLAADGHGPAGRRATGPTPNCSPTWSWGPPPRRAASRCCGPRSTSSCGASTRWSSPSTAPRPPRRLDLFLSLSDAKEQSRRSPRRRLLPGADLPELRPALLREVVPGPGIRPRGQEPAPGLRARQRRPGRRRQGQRRLVHRARRDRHPPGPDATACWKKRMAGPPPARPAGPGPGSAASAGRCTGSPSARCLADGCGHQEPLLPLIAFGSGLSACPSCSSPSFRIGGRAIEPARKVQAVTVSDVHILAQAMINAAPEGHKKLIIFADSRQDAAFQAGLDAGPRPPHPPAAHDARGHRRGRHRRSRSTPSPTS